MRRNLLIAAALTIAFALICFLALYPVFARLSPKETRHGIDEKAETEQPSPFEARIQNHCYERDSLNAHSQYIPNNTVYTQFIQPVVWRTGSEDLVPDLPREESEYGYGDT